MSLFAKKSLGQHFLKSTHVLDQIITAAKITPSEKILEIGPGEGVLTEALLKTGANVIAVEKDNRVISTLEQRFAQEISAGKLTILEGDILEQEIFNLSNNDSLKNNKYAVIANIPYYITGAILQKFLESEPRPNRMVLLVQKEVADRIVARDAKESILSVSVKVFGTPRIIAKVPPGAFSPPPTVDSAILAIENISAEVFAANNIDIKRFFTIVRAGFAHKRKFLARNLELVLKSEEIREIWLKLGLNEKVRAEDLKIEQWVQMAQEVLGT